MFKRFNAIMLNAKGLQKVQIEDVVDEADEFSRKCPIIVDTQEIESVFPRAIPRLGHKVCQLRLKTGDTYDVVETLDEIETIILRASESILCVRHN